MATRPRTWQPNGYLHVRAGSIHELADDLSRQIDGRQSRPAAGYVLFGHSMGAVTAFEMALTHSDHGLQTARAGGDLWP